MNEVDCCRAFVVQLQSEHRTLHDDLARIDRNWLNLVEQPPQPEGDFPLLHELRELRAEIARHFTSEEQGGCMEEAVCRCPSKGSDADKLERIKQVPGTLRARILNP